MTPDDTDGVAAKVLDGQIFISIGENCLPQGIIDRKKLTSIVSPFSWARSNIQYATQILEGNFHDLISDSRIVYDERYGRNYVVNPSYQCDSTLFERSVSSGFEFTHHDIIAHLDHKESYRRKIDRFLEGATGNAPINLLYHHRFHGRMNIERVVSDVQNFVDIYRRRGANVQQAIIMTQKIVGDRAERRIEVSNDGGVSLAVFHTTKSWGGNDPDVLWAKVDDDLIDEMLLIIGSRLS